MDTRDFMSPTQDISYIRSDRNPKALVSYYHSGHGKMPHSRR